MRKIKTTMRPDEDIEVDEDEYLDLKRQNLIDSETEPDPEPEPKTEKKETKNAERV